MVVVAPRQETAPVLAVLVCHDGAGWLSEVVAALRESTVRPQRIVAVDTGSSDRSAELLAASDDLLDAVVTLPRGTGFGTAVSAAVAYAAEHWGDPSRWLWLLHDDSAPAPDCLQRLLQAADADPAAAMLGPLGVDWDDPRLVVDAGLSADASGGAQTGLEPSEVDLALSSSVVSSEVLAVSSACSLLRRDVFEQLGGFDESLPLSWDDIDLGWRINADGHLVLLVPAATMRHAAALRREKRIPDALPRTLRAANRVHGVRTFLANTSLVSFVAGVPRLLLAALLRMLVFALLGRTQEATTELGLAGRLLTGRLKLISARTQRRIAIPLRHNVGGLLTSRFTRLRNGFRALFASLVRERVSRDVEIGLTPKAVTVLPAAPLPMPLEGVPESTLRKPRRRGVAGLRRFFAPVVVPVSAAGEREPRPSPRPRPSQASPAPELLLVPVDRMRVVRELLLSPPVALTAALVAFALITHGVLAELPRFGLGLHGGRLLPAADLGATWSGYLASWHPVNGGTGAPAPPSLLVLALLGTVLAPVGGPSAVLSVVMLFGVPLAGLSAYAASRKLPASRSWRALVAAAYALVPAATLSAVQGRVDVVVAHILLPVLLSGIASVIGLTSMGGVGRQPHWLAAASLTALGLAVLGAFAPLMLVVLILLALLGFVLIPGGVRRGAGIAAIVLLPVACLLPWPIVLVRQPQVLLHGIGARAAEHRAGLGLLGLVPDSSQVSWGGVVLVVLAVLAAVVARSLALLPGLLVAAAGWAVAWAVGTLAADPITGGPATPGWTGGPLLLVACGLCWVVLTGVRGGQIRGISRPATAAVLAGSLVLLALSSALAGRSGPLTVQDGKTTPAVESDLAGSSVLVVGEPGPGPARILMGARSHFGDDDFVPVQTTTDWLLRMDADLLSGSSQRIQPALAAAAARGAGYIALPASDATLVQQLAGDLVAENGALPNGYRLLRILLPDSQVKLLGPDLARQARLEPAPSPEARPLVVPATLPHVAVRVSPGGMGRVLLLGAANEPGWQAEIDGHTAPLATAWGHQVAVPLPASGSEVTVTFTELPRTTLLVLQAAAILFCLVGALPERRNFSRNVRRTG